MPSAKITDYMLLPRSYIYVLIPNPLPSAVALRIELLWAVSSRRPPRSLHALYQQPPTFTHRPAEATNVRAGAAARAAVSAFVVVIVCASVAKQAAFSSSSS